MMLKTNLPVKKFNFKHESCATGDFRRTPALAVSILGSASQHANLTSLHGGNAQVPTLDHLV